MNNPSVRPKPKRSNALVNKVLERDRNICQCCYAYGGSSSFEVHHIHWLGLGGADEANNMIALCSSCHYGAPDEPDRFLEYQRQGGVGSQVITALALKAIAKESPNMPIAAALDRVMQSKHNAFDQAWHCYPDPIF